MCEIQEHSAPFKRKRRRTRRALLSPSAKATRNRANYRRRSRNRAMRAMAIGRLGDSLLIQCAIPALFPESASPAERKAAIIDARLRDDLTDRQTEMLIAAFGLKYE